MIFHFFFGGYDTEHFEVVLKSNELHFYVSDYPIRIKETEPSHIVSIKDDVDWQNLVRFIESLKWNKIYDSDILDGLQWELNFKSENNKLKCYGNNAYPDDFDNLISLINKITKKHKISSKLIR